MSVCRSMASAFQPNSFNKVQAVARKPCGVTSVLRKPHLRSAWERAWA